MNVGGLSFTYGLETDDVIGNSYVFNAHDAAWITFARNLFTANQVMYRNRESAGCFNSANFLKKLNDWQATRPERVWVADAQRKYLRPYEDNGTETYLPMLAGKKTHQREQVKTYNAYYYASKYVSDFCTSQNIMVRGNTPTSGQSILVVPPENTAVLSMYIDCYIVVASTSYNVVAKVKAKRGQTYTMDFSTIGSMGETELYFCTAPMITELSGLAHLYFKQNNFAMGTNLQRLEIGSGVEGYENPNLEGLTIGNNKMLEYLDVRNCPNATGALDLSGCVSLSEVYLENTGFTGISFATGGLLRIAHLPSPTGLTMRELIYLEDLTLESVDNLSTLRIEDCDFDDTTELTIGSTTKTQGQQDIILNLVDSSDNLSRVRLIGIDWTLIETAILNRLLGLTGIDDSSFDISQSVLTGEVYISGAIRNQELLNYENAWANLDVTYDATQLIEQYLITYVNADGTVLYTEYVDRGSAPSDPVSTGAITIPTLEPTAQYIYSYTGWDDIESLVLSPRTITAQYSTTVRQYTVTWYSRAGLALASVTVNYGDEAIYPNEIPTNTSEESSFIYNVFSGWDKSTGYVTGDLDVYAVWQRASLPSTSIDLSQMSPVEIFGVCTAGRASSYFEDKDYFDMTLGSDFNFSNVESQVILQNRYFDGTQSIDTDIKLFDASAPSFTLAIEYEFVGSNSSGASLVSCFEESGSEGFRLRYSGNPNIQWGDRSVTVGYGQNKNIVVLRHQQGSTHLFVYAFNVTDTTYDLSLTSAELVRTRNTEVDSVLTFGAIRFLSDGGHDYYAKGWIHWCKIWYDDLGATVSRKLASWTHDKLRMEFIGANRYRLSGSTSQRANASFLANNLLPLLRRMNSSNTNVGGWDECEMRGFLNDRVWEGMPYIWQAMIKSVKMLASAGNQSTEIITSDDKIYLASSKEMNGYSSEPYASEGDSISWYTTNAIRCKFNNMIIPDTARYFSIDTDPTQLTGYNVQEGDVWIHTGNSSYGYIYLSAETIANHTKYGYRTIADSANIQASDGGLWLRAYYFWLRSPYASSSTYFVLVYNYGSVGFTGYASGALGLCLGFSV